MRLQRIGHDLVIEQQQYYSIIKENEIFPFAATWIVLQNILLIEISQRNTNTMWYNLNQKNNKNESTYKTETDSHT